MNTRKPHQAILTSTILVGSIVVLLNSTSAQAQSGSWLGDAAGDWGDSTKWTSGTIATGAGNTATFGNVITAARIINLDGARTIGNITASDTSHDYTISGANILTLDRTDATKPTINVGTAGRILTISSVISGSDGLQKTGAGILTLSGNNTFSGGITLGAGTLRLSGAAPTFTGGVTLSAGTVLGDNTVNVTPAALNGNAITVNGNASIGSQNTATVYTSNVTLSAGLLTLANNNGSSTWSGQFTDVGGIVVGQLGLGANSVNLTGLSNNFTGGVDYSNTTGGTAQLNVNSFADSASSGAGNIRFGVSSGAGAHAFNYHTGATTSLTLANRQFNLAGTGPASVQINNNSGQTFTISSNTANLGTGTRTLTLGGTGAGLSTFSGNITNGTLTTLSVAKSATANQWNLSGNNTFNGGLSTGNGGATSTLGLGSATAWGTGTFTIGSGRFDNTSGATLAMSGDNAIAWNGDNTFVGTNSLNLGTGAVTMGGNRTITVGGGGLTMGGVVSGAFNIIKGGGGTFVLSGLNSYSGRTTVNQGVLSINTIGNVSGGDSALGNPTTAANGTIGLGSTTLGGTLLFTGAGTSTNRVVNLNGTTGGAALNMSGTGTLTFTSPFTATGAGDKTLTLTGSTAGTGVIEGAIVDNSGSNTTALAKTGSGTWTLSGPNTYSGGTTMGSGSSPDVGTLNITHSSALGTGALSITSNSGNLNKATLTLNSATGITVANNFTTSGTGSGNNGIIRSLTGANEISGTFTLGGGGGNTQIQSDGGSLTLSGDIAPSTTGRSLLLAGSATGTVSGDINDGSVVNTLVDLIKQGIGTWTLSGNNGYTGSTTVSAGTLLVNGSISGSSSVTVAASSTLGGTGSITNAVTVSGTLAPGASVQSLASGALSMNTGSTLAVELDSSVATSVGADLMRVNGNLTLTGTVNLTLNDIATTDVAFAQGTKFSLLNYTGAWNGGFFTVGVNELSDGESFTLGLNEWEISYADATGGVNFTSDYAGGSDSFVNITAVPEPGSALMLIGGLATLVSFRRRRA